MSASPTEHLDVVVIGAGLSGICAGHYLQSDCPWASYTILEARGAIGGTWDLFRYPGVRSDSDMFTLGYPFRPWPSDRVMADGPSILRYIEDTAAEERIDRHIRFNHRVIRAEWSTQKSQWFLTAERTDSGETVSLTCGYLLSCSGYYRYDRGYEPEFPGIERFEGTVVHPQAWPDDLDHTGKRVVVIGSGATAVTLVPAMADTTAHVTMVQRSPTYVVTVPARNPVAAVLNRVLPGSLGAKAVRWLFAVGTQAGYEFSRRRPGLVRRAIRAGVRRQLPDGYDVDVHFNPRYDPWDERMCAVPSGDLFKAISSGRASVVTDHIDSFTEHGLRLRSGAELEADIVVTATGLELLFLGGVELVVDGEPVELSDRLTYKGMMLEGVPNVAFAVGYTNASWTLKCDLTCAYVARLLNHMRRHGYVQAVPVNDDPSIDAAPLLDLSSGYIRRALDRMPKQGDRPPWRVYQSYLRDYRAMRLGGIEDGVLRLDRARSQAATGRS